MKHLRTYRTMQDLSDEYRPMREFVVTAHTERGVQSFRVSAERPLKARKMVYDRLRCDHHKIRIICCKGVGSCTN